MQQNLFFSFYSIIFLSEFISTIKLTKDQDYLLKAHNRIRQYARSCNITGQPQAKRILNLVWDDQLALKATELSKTCNFRFSNVTTYKFKDVGQNIAGYANVQTAMDEWVNEYQYYDFDSNTCNSKSCGNYLQIVWQKTTHIGCGVTDCRKSPQFPYGVFVVCNYAPGAKFDKSPYDVVSHAKCSILELKWKRFNLNGQNCYCYL